MSDGKQQIDVAAGLIFRDGKLLIAQRHPNAHLGGLWEFPGGKCEPGETFKQCLVREIREELGVEIRVGELYETVTHAYPEKIVHLKFFTCRLIQGEPKSLDSAAIQWVELFRLANYKFPAADNQLIGRLMTAL